MMDCLSVYKYWEKTQTKVQITVISFTYLSNTATEMLSVFLKIKTPKRSKDIIGRLDKHLWIPAEKNWSYKV